MLVLRVAVLLASILSLRGEMCSTMVTIAPGEEGKPLTAKAFAEFTAKCRKDRNKVTLKPVTTKQPSVTTTISSLTTSVPPLTTEIPSTTAEPPSTATLMQPPTTNFRQTTRTTKVSTTPLATPCFLIQTKSNDVKHIPESRDFTSYPVVLLFTLQNSASYSIELRFMDAAGIERYTMAMRRGAGASTIGSAAAVFNTEFDASIMFRMSYGDGLISLEALDESGTSMTHTYSPSPDNDVKYIELYSKTKTPTEWTFYKTCATFL